MARVGGHVGHRPLESVVRGVQIAVRRHVRPLRATPQRPHHRSRPAPAVARQHHFRSEGTGHGR